MKSRFFLALLAGATMVAPMRAAEPPPPLPTDLSEVSPNALGFVHLRVADIWKSDSLKDMRDTLMKAGAKALKGFDKRFLPHPSTIDRLTVVVVPADENLQREPHFYAILATTEAIERGEFLKSSLPNAVEKKTRHGNYFADQKQGVAISFVGDKVIVVGPIPAIDHYISNRSNNTGPLTPAIRLADSKRHLFAAVNASLIPEKSLSNAPPAVRPLLKAQVVTLALDATADLQIDLGIAYADDERAKDAQDAIGALATMGRNELKTIRKDMLAKVLGDGKVAPIQQLPEAAMALLALGSIESIDELLANPPIKRQGHTLNASLKVPSGPGGVVAISAVGVGLLLPAVQKVREAASRVSSQNNLKQIALAMLNYESAYGKLPSAAICDKNGKPLLSWRVAILPFIEQNNLYQQFKLDEPWDSEHNIKLSKYVIKTYTHPQQPQDTLGLSHYRLFYGKDAMFDLTEGRTFVQVTDGLSNTIMAVEAAEGVPWTKPDDFLYDPKKPLPKLGGLTPNVFNVAMGDGSVRFLSNSVSEKTLRAMITANGGELIEEEDNLPRNKPSSKPTIKIPPPVKE